MSDKVRQMLVNGLIMVVAGLGVYYILHTHH